MTDTQFFQFVARVQTQRIPSATCPEEASQYRKLAKGAQKMARKLGNSSNGFNNG